MEAVNPVVAISRRSRAHSGVGRVGFSVDRLAVFRGQTDHAKWLGLATDEKTALRAIQFDVG